MIVELLIARVPLPTIAQPFFWDETVHSGAGVK